MLVLQLQAKISPIGTKKVANFIVIFLERYILEEYIFPW